VSSLTAKKAYLVDTTNIPKDELVNLLKAHNMGILSGKCDPGENRFKDPKFGLYCWRGIARRKEELEAGKSCIIAEACSPQSFSDARTRFCLTFGCPDPFRYTDNTLPGEVEQGAVANRRGGVLVFNNKEKCTGLAGVLGCVGDGVKQSIDNVASNTESHKNLLISVGGLIAIALGIRIIFAKKKKLNFLNKRG